MELDHPFSHNNSAFLKNIIVMIGAPPVRSGSKILSIIDHLGLKKVTEVAAYDINRGKKNIYNGEIIIVSRERKILRKP